MFFHALSSFCQLFINAVAAGLSALVALLPGSPFTFLDSSAYGDLLGKINFFIPVYEFVSIAQAWLVAVGVYYLYAFWARWVKAIE